MDIYSIDSPIIIYFTTVFHQQSPYTLVEAVKSVPVVLF